MNTVFFGAIAAMASPSRAATASISAPRPGRPRWYQALAGSRSSTLFSGAPLMASSFFSRPKKAKSGRRSQSTKPKVMQSISPGCT